MEAGAPLGSYCNSVSLGNSTSSPGFVFLICEVRMATRLAFFFTDHGIPIFEAPERSR